MDIFKIKKNDTLPALGVTLQYANGSAIDLTNGSVWFNMGNYTDYSSYFSGLCVITGSTSGQCEYRWNGSSDTGSIGTYWAEFEMQLGTGSIMTLPTNHSLKIEISEDYD